VETQLDTHVATGVGYGSTRTRVIALLGPLTVVGGLAWAILQPYRLTLLHPQHQSVWWLIAEPPLLVAAAGLVFALAIARPLIDDLESHGAAR
jgi:hypothetical protein